MAKNLGAQVLALLDHDRVDLRAAAATVLVAVGAGDPAVEKGLVERLADSDSMVRRIALEGLVSAAGWSAACSSACGATIGWTSSLAFASWFSSSLMMGLQAASRIRQDHRISPQPGA